MEALWLILLGCFTGTIGVMVGIGGGIILVPVLLLFTTMEPSTLAGTSLALVAINSYSGSWTYMRMGFVDVRSGLLFSIAAVPGAVFAPFVVASVASDEFRILFGILLVAVAIQMVFRSWVTRGRERNSGSKIRFMRTTRRITSSDGQLFQYEFNEGLATTTNVVLGFIAAFFGTGGGFLRTPLLVTFFGFPVRVAVATSVFALSIYTTAGASAHIYLGHVNWYPILLWAGVGLMVGGQVGARLAAKVRTLWILRVLTFVLFVMGVRLIVEGFIL